MAMMKSPRGLVDLFEASLPQGPGLERRRMFGCPCAFVNGNMFAGLYEDVTFVRLPPSLREAFEAEYGARCFEPRPGFQMRAYTELPEEVVEDEGRYAEILRAAFVFASALAPKARKPRRKAS
jgi:TfoX/Sxy family transcriptional regulator of competence genes